MAQPPGPRSPGRYALPARSTSPSQGTWAGCRSQDLAPGPGGDSGSAPNMPHPAPVPPPGLCTGSSLRVALALGQAHRSNVARLTRGCSNQRSNLHPHHQVITQLPDDAALKRSCLGPPTSTRENVRACSPGRSDTPPAMPRTKQALTGVLTNTSFLLAGPRQAGQSCARAAGRGVDQTMEVRPNHLPPTQALGGARLRPPPSRHHAPRGPGRKGPAPPPARPPREPPALPSQARAAGDIPRPAAANCPSCSRPPSLPAAALRTRAGTRPGRNSSGSEQQHPRGSPPSLSPGPVPSLTPHFLWDV